MYVDPNSDEFSQLPKDDQIAYLKKANSSLASMHAGMASALEFSKNALFDHGYRFAVNKYKHLFSDEDQFQDALDSSPFSQEADL